MQIYDKRNRQGAIQRIDIILWMDILWCFVWNGHDSGKYHFAQYLLWSTGKCCICIGNQLYNAINTLSNSIVVAFRPTLIKSYSCQDMPYIQQLYFSANKAILYLLCLVAIPLMLETEYVLQFWLGYSTPEIILFCRLYIIYTIILTLHNPITIIIQATGKSESIVYM